MHKVQKCLKWCNYAHVEKNRSKSRNFSNEHLFVPFRGCRYSRPTCSFDEYAAIVDVSASWSLQVHQREWAERVCGRQTTWSHQRGWASGICVRFASDHHGSSGKFRKCSGQKIYKDTILFRDSKPSQLLILGVISPKILTDQPFFGNDEIRRVLWISGLWGVFCWNIPCSHWDWSKLLRWTLLPTDHLGSIIMPFGKYSIIFPTVNAICCFNFPIILMKIALFSVAG